MSKDEEDLLDPAKNDLIPSGDNAPEEETPEDDPPELSPDYEERAPRRARAAGEAAPLLDILKDAAGGGCGCKRIAVKLGGAGLEASSCPKGGLSVFKNGAQVFSTSDLSAEDQTTIQDFLDRAR